MRTLTADEMKDAKATATHEAGHFIVAEKFGLHPYMGLLTCRDGYCRMDHPASREAGESVCWAGFLAEDLLGCRTASRTIPATPLTEATLDQYIREVRDVEASNAAWLSKTDRELISGFDARKGAPYKTFYILAQNRGELAELAEATLKLFTPSLARNGQMNLTALKAAMAQVGGSRYPLADTAAERLAQLTLDARNAEKDALTATIAAQRFASDLDRLGTLGTPEAHRHAADLHFAAAKLLLAAKRAVEVHNVAWAKEFSDALAVGDEAGAHSASWAIDIRKPLALRRSADAEMRKMINRLQN